LIATTLERGNDPSVSAEGRFIGMFV